MVELGADMQVEADSEPGVLDRASDGSKVLFPQMVNSSRSSFTNPLERPHVR